MFFFLYILGNTILRCLLTDQITHLVVEIKDETITELSDENKLHMLPLILSLSKRLTDLSFCECFSDRNLKLSIFNLPSTSCVSSTLTKLKVNVRILNDCLDFLDGRLTCLSTLIICVEKIVYALPIRHSMVCIILITVFCGKTLNYTER